MKKTFTIVTACSANHFAPMLNLLWTVSRFAPEAKVVAFDLGMESNQLAWLSDAPPFFIKDFQIRTFDFSRFPSHFDMEVNAGQYAWKPTIINEILDERGGIVLWLDAGCVVRGPLHDLKAAILRDGLYAPAIVTTVGGRTHTDCLDAMDARDLVGRRMRDACVVGFDAESSLGKNVAERWAKLALDAAIIGPPGSDKRNHAQDESILSILAYKSGTVLEDRWLDVVGHKDRWNLAQVKLYVGLR